MRGFDFSSDDVLLDIDAVCKKLCISRSSLERLRRRSNQSLPSGQTFSLDDDFIGAPAFPEPTLVLGRSPRWSAQVLNEWIRATANTSRRSVLT